MGTAALQMQTYTVIVAGQSCSVTVDQAKERAIKLSGEFLAKRSNSMAAFCELGFFLVQMKQHVGHGGWGGFLNACGIHSNRAAKAMRLARLCMRDDGTIDTARLDKRLQEEGRKPSQRQAEIVAGARRETPAPKFSHGRNLERPAKLPERQGFIVGGRVLSDDDVMHLQGFASERAPAGMGGGNGSIAVAGAKDAVAAGRSGTLVQRGQADGDRPYGSDVSGSGERIGIADRPGLALGGTSITTPRSGRKVDVAGQMTLAEEYAHAASFAERALSQFRDGTADVEFTRAFLELARRFTPAGTGGA
jgi:hypothetical protein